MPASTLTYALPNAPSFTTGNTKSTIVHNKISTSTTSFQPQNDDRDGGGSTISSVTLPFSVGGTKVLYPPHKSGYASSKASSVSEFDNYPVSPSPSIPDSNISYQSRGSTSRRTHATIFLNDQEGNQKTSSKVDLTVASETGLPADELRKFPEQVLQRAGSSLSNTSSNRGVQKLTIKMLLTEKRTTGESTMTGGERTLTMAPPSGSIVKSSPFYQSQLLPSKLAEPTAAAPPSSQQRRAFSYSNRYVPRSQRESTNLSASDVELCKTEYLIRPSNSMSSRIGIYEKRPASRAYTPVEHGDVEAFVTKPIPYRSYERLDIENEDGGKVIREVKEVLKDNVVTVEVHEKGDGLSKDRLAQVQQDEKNDAKAIDGTIGKALDTSLATGTLALPDKPTSPPRSRRDKYELHQAMSWKREIELRPTTSNDRLSGQSVTAATNSVDYQVARLEEDYTSRHSRQQQPVSLREETRVAESRAVSAPEQRVPKVWQPEPRRVPEYETDYLHSSTMATTVSSSRLQYRSIFDKNFTENRIDELRKSASDLRALADGAFDGSTTFKSTEQPFTATRTTTVTSGVERDYPMPDSGSVRRPLPVYGGSTTERPYSTGDFSYKFGKENVPSSRYSSVRSEAASYKDIDPVTSSRNDRYKEIDPVTSSRNDRYKETDPVTSSRNDRYKPPTTASNDYRSSYRPADNFKPSYIPGTSDSRSTYQPRSSLGERPKPTDESADRFKCNYPIPPEPASQSYAAQYGQNTTTKPFKCDFPPRDPGYSKELPEPPPRMASSGFAVPPYKSYSEEKHVTEETVSKTIKTTTSKTETFQVPQVGVTVKDPEFKYITQYKSTPTLPATAQTNEPTKTFVRDSMPRKTEEPVKVFLAEKPREPPTTSTYSTQSSAFKPVDKTARKPAQDERISTGSSWVYGYKLPEETLVRAPSVSKSDYGGSKSDYGGSLPRGYPTKTVEPAVLESLRKSHKPSPPTSPDIRPKDWVPPCKAKILQAKRKYMAQAPPPAPRPREDPWGKYKSGSRDKVQIRMSQESLNAVNREARRGSVRGDNRYSMPDLRGSQKTLADPSVYRSKIQWPEREIQNKIRASQEYLQRNYDDEPTSSFANRWDSRSRSLPPMSRYSKSAATTPIESPYPEYIDSNKAKSMEFLSDVKKYDYQIVPENQLQRENISGYSRTQKDEKDDNPYVEQVRKSLQKLDLPDWYVNSPYSQPGVMEGAILRNRAQSTTESNYTESKYSPYATLDRSELTSPTGTMHSTDAVVISKRILPEYSKVATNSKTNLSTSREDKVWDGYTSSFYNKKPSRPTPIYSPASEINSRRPYHPHDSGWSSDWNSHHESSPDSDESNTESRNSPRTWSGKVAPPVSSSSDWYKPPLGDRRRDRSEPSRATSSHHPGADSYNHSSTVANREQGPPPYSSGRPSTYFDPTLSQRRVVQSTPWEVTSIKTETFKTERLAKKNYITETNDPVKIAQFSQESSQWGSYV